MGGNMDNGNDAGASGLGIPPNRAQRVFMGAIEAVGMADLEGTGGGAVGEALLTYLMRYNEAAVALNLISTADPQELVKLRESYITVQSVLSTLRRMSAMGEDEKNQLAGTKDSVSKEDEAAEAISAAGV